MTRLYKVTITALPVEARCYYVEPLGDPADHVLGDDYEASDTWEPEDWAEICHTRWGEHRPFHWPSTKKIYTSRSGAKARADLIQSYGAVTTITTSETVVWQTAEYLREQRLEQLRLETAKLFEQWQTKSMELSNLRLLRP